MSKPTGGLKGFECIDDNLANKFSSQNGQIRTSELNVGKFPEHGFFTVWVYIVTDTGHGSEFLRLMMHAMQ